MMKNKNPYSKQEGLILVVTIILGSVLVSVYLYAINVPKEVSIALITGLFTFCAAVLPKILEPKKSRGEIKDPSKLFVHRKPVVVALLATSLFLFSMAFLALYNGFFFFVIYGHFEPPSSNEEQARIGAEVGTFTVLLLLPITVAIAKYASHRIKNNALLWIIGVVSFGRVIPFMFTMFFVPSLLEKSTIFASAGSLLFLLGAALLGHLWAKRTHDEYIVRQVFKHLSPTDRQSFIALITTSSKRWKVSKRPRSS